MFEVFNDDDEKEKQKFWNLVTYKIYATDEELEDILPTIAYGSLVLAVIALIIYGVYSYTH